MPKIKLHPFFIALIVASIVFGKLGLVLITLASIAFHELGHYLVAARLGYYMNTLTIMPYGAMLSGDYPMTRREELLISVSGPAFSLIICIVLAALWWFIPSLYPFTETLMLVNICIAGFNVLPAFPLDGSRITLAIFGHRKRVFFIVKLIGIILSLTCLGVFIISAFFIINYNYAIMSLVFMCGALSEKNSSFYEKAADNIPYSYKFGSGLKETRVIVPDSIPIYKLLKFIKKNTYTVFLITNSDFKIIAEIDETTLKEIFVNYKLTTILSQILTDLQENNKL